MLLITRPLRQPVALPQEGFTDLKSAEGSLLESEHCLRMQGGEREQLSHFQKI